MVVVEMMMFHGKGDILNMRLSHRRWWGGREDEGRRWEKGERNEEVKKGGAWLAKRNDRGVVSVKQERIITMV